MKHLILSACLLVVALTSPVAESGVDGAAMAEVRDLGRMNGLSLACSYREVTARIKSVMIKHAPKSRRYGDAFEAATSEAFGNVVKKAPDGCGDAAALAGQVDRSAIRLRAAVPAELSRQGAVPAAWSSPIDPEQPEPGVIPRYLLMDANGRAVTQQDFPGKFQLITFGYTFCPDICPTTLAEMSLILDKLGEQSDRLQPIFITVDPERDSRQKLAQYTAFFDARIIGLAGSPDLIRSAAQNFHVLYSKHTEPGAAPDMYSMDHSAGMYLLGPDGRYLGKLAYGTLPAEAAERIRQVVAGEHRRPSSGPVQQVPRE